MIPQTPYFKSFPRWGRRRNEANARPNPCHSGTCPTSWPCPLSVSPSEQRVSKDLLQEVLKMNGQKAIYGLYIPEEELPVRAGLRVIRRSDPDYGLSEEEAAGRNEFIRCYLMREFELLMMLPEPESKDLLIADFPVTNEAYSAFNTVDFQRMQRPFDNYGYAMQKIMERVLDLAIMHAAIAHKEGKRNICRRFNALIDYEFRERLLRCVDWYKAAKTDEQKSRLKQKIGELNRRIIECRKVWEQQNAP